jgi:hypothetical protein
MVLEQHALMEIVYGHGQTLENPSIALHLKIIMYRVIAIVPVHVDITQYFNKS